MANMITFSLLRFSNLHLVKADFDEIFKDSPLEDLWKSGRVTGAFQIESLLRLPLLYK